MSGAEKHAGNLGWSRALWDADNSDAASSAKIGTS